LTINISITISITNTEYYY